MGRYADAFRAGREAMYRVLGWDPSPEAQQARAAAIFAGTTDGIDEFVRLKGDELARAEPSDEVRSDPFADVQVHSPPRTKSNPVHPRRTPDGPVEPFGFVWRCRTLDFSGATTRYMLLVELWDNAAGRPHPARPETDVMEVLWPDDDAADANLKDLTYRVNQVFREAGINLFIKRGGGKIWLLETPA